MEKIVRQSLLYDFYGELLTEHQKAIYEDVVNNDMSYSEIARMNQISRQGVYDMIKRCDKILDKLQLVDKFMKARKQVEKMKDCISELMEENRDDRLNSKIEAIDRLSDRILDEF